MPVLARLVLSIISDQGGQPFRIGDIHALKEDNVLISEILQANNPGGAAVAKLVAKLLFGIILKNDHGCLMLGQCHRPGQKLVITFLGRGGRLKHLAGLVVPGLNDQCGIVGVAHEVEMMANAIRANEVQMFDNFICSC